MNSKNKYIASKKDEFLCPFHGISTLRETPFILSKQHPPQIHYFLQGYLRLSKGKKDFKEIIQSIENLLILTQPVTFRETSVIQWISIILLIQLKFMWRFIPFKRKKAELKTRLHEVEIPMADLDFARINTISIIKALRIIFIDQGG